MPHTKKCQDCRKHKKGCDREGKVWNEQDPETKCRTCREKNFACGPDVYKNENELGGLEATPDIGQRLGADRADQMVAPMPNGVVYTKENLENRLRELGNSEDFQMALHAKLFLPQFRSALEIIETLADQACVALHTAQATLAYNRVIDWYGSFGEEAKQSMQDLIMKAGAFYEGDRPPGPRDQAAAESCYLKMFDDIPMLEQDAHNLPHTRFHHAVRHFNRYGHFSQDALQGIIRCCPSVQFGVRNSDRQTPLGLALSIENNDIEEVVRTMIARIRRLSNPPRYFNATDTRGQTILTTAVLSKRSYSLIAQLIHCGSDVNPLRLEALTPLQAASYPAFEQPEIATLLLMNHANPDDALCYPNSIVAQQIISGNQQFNWQDDVRM